MSFDSLQESVPFNARFDYPDKSIKAKKVTPRIPPFSGDTFLPDQVIRLEFPDQGYLNPLNTTIEFDVTLLGPVVTTAGVDGLVDPEDPESATAYYSVSGSALIYFQNNIQSIFNRVRIMYGSTPLEDIISYNQIVRNLTEWTGTNQTITYDQQSISEGIGGIVQATSVALSVTTLMNTRARYIQSLSGNFDTGNFDPDSFGNVPNSAGGVSCDSSSVGRWACTRRYQIQLTGSGFMTQDKLIPLKFMASQLAIELTLGNPESCIMQRGNWSLLGAIPEFSSAVAPVFASPVVPTYTVSGVNLIPEILEFDSQYDSLFLRGMQSGGGIPIKFASWHSYQYSTKGGSTCRLQINEGSKSIKAMFCVQTAPSSYTIDSHATVDGSGTNSVLKNYQWKIGNTYYPPSPVQGTLLKYPLVTNNGCEAFIELQKALAVVGNHSLSTSMNTMKWSVPSSTVSVKLGDYIYYPTIFDSIGSIATTTIYSPYSSTFGASCYCAAINLETSNGIDISGINAQDTAEIAFIGQWSNAQNSTYTLTVFVYYDAICVLKPNNIVELIQ